MTTFPLIRGFLTEFFRRPLNAVLLVAVPLIFVSLAASAIADFAEIVGGITDPRMLASPTAGWAAAFLSGIAGYFHVLGSRSADQRLADSGMGAGPIVRARMVSGLVMAAAATIAAVAALAVRTGIDNPPRAVLGALMFSLIYLGIGVLVGALTTNEINGSLIIIFVWMLDVFLGPAMSGGSVWLTRLFPSHYPTLVMLDSASGHSGPIGDLGWAVLWTAAALGIAAVTFSSVVGARLQSRSKHSRLSKTLAAIRHGLSDYRRNPALWVLLIVLPVFFITLSFYITPDQPTAIELREAGGVSLNIVSMIDVHGALMVPITIGFLAGLVGLFVVQGALDADSRLAIAGYGPTTILAARFTVITIGVVVTTLVSLAVTAIDFSAASWVPFALGNAAVGIIYGLIGVIVGMVAGKLGGMYVMFLLPFIDIGVAQNVMFSAAPPAWGSVLPGRGPVRLLVDGAFTASFDEMGSVWLTLGWMVVLIVITSSVFRIITGRTH